MGWEINLRTYKGAGKVWYMTGTRGKGKVFYTLAEYKRALKTAKPGTKFFVGYAANGEFFKDKMIGQI